MFMFIQHFIHRSTICHMFSFPILTNYSKEKAPAVVMETVEVYIFNIDINFDVCRH